MADMVTKQELEAAKIDVKHAGEAVNEKKVINPRYGAPFKSLPLVAAEAQAKADEVVSEIRIRGGYFKTYNSLAEANADIANIPVGEATVRVRSELNGGDYYKAMAGATTLTKSAYDPLEIAKKDATDKAADAKNQAVYNSTHSIAELQEDLNFIENTGDLIPLEVGSNGGIILAYSKSKQKLVGLGLQDENFYNAYAIMANSKIFDSLDAELVPILVGSNGGIILAYSKSKNKLVGLFDFDTNTQNLLKELNQFLFFGQSLSRGYLGTPILSLTQPKENLTFTGGSHPTALTSLIPLIENESESPCSGAANYAAYIANKENGINHKIIASTAGVNDALLSALSKGTSAYSNMIAQVTAAQNLKGSQTHAVQAIGWLQGESNLRDAVNLSTYENDLKAHFENIQNDIQIVTKQASKPRVITYQLSTRIGLSDAVCKAQLNLCKQKLTAIASPTYHLPYNADGVHLTNVGYKWIGTYFGRAYKQWVIDGHHPDYLEPLSAELVGNKIIVAFNVPQKPLVFDTTALAATQDHGFSVRSNATLLAIANIEAKENTVEITLSDIPNISNLSVRYGLDYMAASKYIRDGKSGNLRDSTAETVLINGAEKPLFHVAPHFELPVISGEI